ncbi:MAG: hypothetical protein OEV80_05585, partial [candidate division Zixibacteria bacterium]|nr:hypothetical protein [candidate division Zixibacteria bacterium]
DSLPRFLKAGELNEFVALTAKARKKGRPFHLMLGAHNIKVGLSPILIDLMRRGSVTSLSFNSAGLIHDLEVSFFGATSEDVQAGLADGSFGMVKKTAELFAAVTHLASKRSIGLGAAAGMFINGERAKHRKVSLFGRAVALDLPVTVHIGIGTDIVAQHPEYNAAEAAEASHLDFRLLASLCTEIDQGGIAANIGSAVILPEVFLKALTVARNVSKHKSRLVTANFDMILQYRPMQNIVSRPTAGCGRGFNFVGHHEIMVPLLAWALRREFER